MKFKKDKHYCKLDQPKVQVFEGCEALRIAIPLRPTPTIRAHSDQNPSGSASDAFWGVLWRLYRAHKARTIMSCSRKTSREVIEGSLFEAPAT